MKIYDVVPKLHTLSDTMYISKEGVLFYISVVRSYSSAENDLMADIIIIVNF